MKTTSAATNGCPRTRAARRRLRQGEIGADPTLQERPERAVDDVHRAQHRRDQRQRQTERQPAGFPPSRPNRTIAADQDAQERREAEEGSLVVVDAAAGRPWHGAARRDDASLLVDTHDASAWNRGIHGRILNRRR